MQHSHVLMPLRRIALAAIAVMALATALIAAPAPTSAYAYNTNPTDAIGSVGCPNGNHPRTYYSKSIPDLMHALEDMTSSRNNPWRETKVTIELFCDWNTKSAGRITIPSGCEVTINLNGHMIDRGKALSYKDMWYAEGKGDVIYVESNATLYLNGGSTPEARAIEHKGDLLDNNKFWKYNGTGGTSMTGGLITGGACDDWHGAGGISLSGSNAKAYIRDTTIAGNLTDQYENRYGHGAGIAVHGSGSVLELANTAVVYNHAEGYGGGIYVRNSNTTVTIKEGCQILNNLGVLNGGGIFLDDAVNLNIESSKVTNNLTHSYGGGIYTNSTSVINISKNSEVNGNRAWGDGGGIYLNGNKTTFTLDASSISGNYGMQSQAEKVKDKYDRKDGAGLYVDGNNSKVYIKNGSNINNNTAQYGRGGGVFIDGDDVSFNVDDSTIHSNKAQFGTGFVMSGGGGIYHNGKKGTVTFTNSELSGNFAGWSGGGIYDAYDDTTFTFDNCVISGNHTWMRGGFMCLNDTATVYLKNGTKVTESTSGSSAIYETGHTGAYGHGGAIYNDDADTKIILTENSSISGNSAIDTQDRNRLSGCGGAVYSSDDMSILSPDGTGQICNNSSYDQGGAIYFEGEMTLQGLTITGNTCVNRTGGGVWCNNSSYKAFTLIDKVVIDDNHSGSGSITTNLCLKGKQEVCSASGDSALAADSKIGVTLDDFSGNGTRRITGNKAALSKIGANYKKAFYADNNEISVTSDGNYVYISSERSDRHRVDVKLKNRDRSSSYAIGDTVTLKTSDFLTSTDYDNGCWNWYSYHTSIINDHRNLSTRNRIDYWTITDAHGNETKVETNDGVATFTMPDSDTTAVPHIIRPASGIGIKIDETASFDELATPSTMSATTSFIDLRDRFWTLFPRCDSGWEYEHTRYEWYVDEWGHDDGGETIWFGESSLVDRDGRYSFDHITEGSKAADAVKVERLGATDVTNDKGLVTARKVNYQVTIDKSLLEKDDFFATTNTSLAQIQALFNDKKDSEALLSNKCGTGSGSYVGEDVCKATVAADGSQVLTFSVTYDNKVTLSYDADGGSMPSDVKTTSKVKVGDELGTLPTPTRASYKFDGWYVKGTDTKVDSKTVITADTALVAKWELLDGERTTHVILFHSEDSAIGLDIVYAGERFAKPEDPTRTGYTFAGWYSDEALTKAYDFNIATGEGSDDINLYAKWNANPCTVTFDSAGGSAVASQQGYYDGKVTKPADPTREGYTFLGWVGSDGNSFAFTQTLTGDVTATAAWGRGVTFAGEGVTASTTAVTDGSIVEQPADPTRDGYRFDGWYADEALTQAYDFTSPVTANITLYAKWTRTVTLTFDSGAGSAVEAMVIEAGTTMNSSELPYSTREGYRFRGWNGADGREVYGKVTFDSDMTLTARWVAKMVKITYHGIDDDTPFILPRYGDTLNQPEDPVRTGYTFDGWYADEDYKQPFTFGQMVTSSLDLYAKWIPEPVSVFFDVEGGSNVESQTVDYDTCAFEPEHPTREGYYFKGWYTDSNLTAAFSFDTPVTAPLTLHAKWVEAVTVSFDTAGGGETPEPVTVEKGAAIGSLPIVARAGDEEASYVLAGWYDGASKADVDTSFDHDTTLKASWVETDTALFATFTDDGVVLDSSVSKAGEPFERPTDPSKDGYTFAGWCTDKQLSKPYDFSSKATGDITLFAKWTEKGKTSISNAKVTLASESLVYTGSDIAAQVASVKVDGQELEADTDYEVSLPTAKDVGTYKVTVIGKGDYVDSATASFEVVPTEVAGLKLKAAGKGKVKASWTKHKIQTTGFELRYAASKAKLAKDKGKAVKVKGAAKTSRVLKNLKKGKKVFVQIRAYKVVDGKVYSSAWGKVKAVKVK